jgi:CheY-like chemotaxis protein
LVELQTRMLKKIGYEVQAFTSSQAALAAARAAPYEIDIIITDLSMPGMSGTDLVEEVRRLRPGLPALIVSGYVDDSSQQRIAALGIQNMLLKPFTLDVIGPAIQDALASKIDK